MSELITTGTSIKCPLGDAEVPFVATHNPFYVIGGKPVGNIDDGEPLINIPSFGLCKSMANPAVAAATAAALGVLTPQPCVPVTKAWMPKQTKMLSNGKPVLTRDCTCMCAYGGQIMVSNPSQHAVAIK